MKRSISAAVASVAILSAVGLPGGAGVLEPNPWLSRRILNIAHQGGENEAPSDTMYAFKSAMAKGADMLEMDVHATADGEIVVLHDATVDRTTNGTGVVDEMTLQQIRTLDAAHWFIQDLGTVHNPSRPASDFTFRGVATGAVSPPAGYSASDFKIPTLREVLQTFPTVPINIEIKATAPDTIPYEKTLADLLAEFGRDDDVIVVSFLDHATEMFKAWAPFVHTATATVETALFYATAVQGAPGSPNPRYVAMQVPMTFMGVTVVTPDFIANAHANGLAVHVWTINDRLTMCTLVGWGVDGIMSDEPTDLEDVLTNGC